MNNPLKELADQYNELEEEEAAEETVEEEVIEEEVVEDPPKEEVIEEETPPGFKSYEDWVAEGGDPEMYKGKKAYEAEYERIQEVKSLKNNIKEMKETLTATVDAVTERERKADERHRKELETAIEQAKEEGDTEAALAAQQDLNDLKPTETPPREHPVIGEFVTNNEVLHASDMKEEFARIYNGKLRSDGVTATQELSDVAIKGYLDASMSSLKTIYPDKFTSPRNNRQTTPRLKSKPATAKKNPEDDIRSNLKITTDYNDNATLDMYNMIKKTASPEAAEQFYKQFKEQLEA